VRRADIVIVTKCDKRMKPIDFRVISSNLHLQANQLPFFTTIQYKDLKPVFTNNMRHLSKIDIEKNDEILLFSGIASPESFVEEVKSWSNKVTVVRFMDHHPFSRKDIAKLDSIFGRMTSPNKFMVVTEKDAARLVGNPFVPKEWQQTLYYLPVGIAFNDEASFDKAIIRHVASFKKNCILH
jgi:tetraacyldisaccharide 4'-kinase